MTEPKIFIATPMYGGQCYGTYANSMITLVNVLARKNWLGTWSFLYNDSLITRARNTLAYQFLKTDYTHILFVDADMSFFADDIVSMIEQDVDIVSALCPKKKIDWELVARAAIAGIPPDQLMTATAEWAYLPLVELGIVDTSKRELVEIEAAGTGLMLIKREVFEQVDVPYYTATTGENVKMFFETELDKDSGLNNYLSEDYNFCRLYRKAGGKIHLAPWTKVKHTGTLTFG
jgi:hypothetical protein